MKLLYDFSKGLRGKYMEDKRKTKLTPQPAGKPGKTSKEVAAGLRKTPAILNLGGFNTPKKGKVTKSC
jgi:hypothetical protein